MKQFLKRRLLMNTQYSLAGLRAAWKTEEAFRVEAVLFALLLPIAFVVGQTPLETAVLIMSLFAVLITELLNTGLEKTIDRISSELHATSKMVKDIGSAAVFISIIQFFIVWGLIILG